MDRPDPGPAGHRPLPDLAQLADPLALALPAFIAGALAGVIIAELLRRRGLAATWTLPLSCACAVPATLAAALAPTSPVGIAAAALLLGAGMAAPAWSLRGRIEDRRAGGDRELAALERRGPLDPLRARAADRRATPGSPGATIAIGRDSRGRLAQLRRGSSASGSHVLIPGATGAGKSTSLAALVVEYVVRSRFGAVILEAKNDDRLASTARTAASRRGVPFRPVSPEGDTVYDPLARGSVDERSERLLAVEEWGSADADFYRQAASPFLRLAIRALDAAGAPATLRSVAAACDPDALENLAARAKDPDLADQASELAGSLRADERRAVAGLRARLLNLADSGFARRWLDPERAGGPALDLRAAIAARQVVYFRFDTDRTGNVGRSLAQMVLLDLGAAASAIMGEGTGTFVAVDEFGGLGASALERLYTRGRSAGMSVAIGTQTVADLREAGPAVRERIGATVESIVCHRIGNQADAEWIAQLIGTVPAWQTTTRTDGLGLATDEGTRTRGHRFEVHPSQLQRLGRGEAYVARLDLPTAERASRVTVVPPWERLPPTRAVAEGR